tara:strand:- start:78 stop:1997 length:1920 start_codon:yes stop_codon:yes gene_type:complete
MNKNPSINRLGIFVFFIIIALVILVVGFMNFNLTSEPSKSTKTDETEDLPTITEAGVDLVINPIDKPGEVEEYSIFKTEYALGESSAKNIDIKLKWTNGPTFATVDELHFVHQNKNGDPVRKNVVTTDNTESNASNELLFKGTDLTSEDIIGSNTIKIYYNQIKDNNQLATVSFTINQDHLDTQFNLTSIKTITVPVQLSSTQTASGDVISTYTNYYILPYLTDTSVYIRKVQGDSDNGFNIIINGTKQIIDNVSKFYIVKGLGKQFLSKDPDGDMLLRYDKKFKSQNEIFTSMNAVVKSAISVREAKPFKYEFFIKHLDYMATWDESSIGVHIHNVKLYDFNDTLIKTVTNNDIEFNVQPTHSVNRSDYLGAWKKNTYNAGDKLFTITSDKPVNELTIEYGRPRYAPGWSIKENGIVRFEDVRNHGSGEQPSTVTYTYTLSRFDDIGDLSYSGYYDISEMEDMGMEYGLISPNSTHNWQWDINTYKGCRQRAKEKEYNAFSFQSPNHTDFNGKQGYCFLRNIPGTGEHTFEKLIATGKGGKEDSHISGCVEKGKKVSNKCKGPLYYGGDSNLGRDGRNACTMTDDDKKYACDNDSELVGIGSGNTCGHKYYNTDKGQGSISSTDKYDKFYSCAEKAYV